MAARSIKLESGALVEIDEERPLSRFMKITTGPAVIRLSYADVLAVVELVAPSGAEPATELDDDTSSAEAPLTD